MLSCVTGGVLINPALSFLWWEVITMFDSSVSLGLDLPRDEGRLSGPAPGSLVFPGVVFHSRWHRSSLGSSTMLGGQEVEELWISEPCPLGFSSMVGVRHFFMHVGPLDFGEDL